MFILYLCYEILYKYLLLKIDISCNNGIILRWGIFNIVIIKMNERNIMKVKFFILVVVGVVVVLLGC